MGADRSDTPGEPARDPRLKAFRDLETLAVLVDIAIDEEAHDALRIQGLRPFRRERSGADDSRPWRRTRYHLFGDTERIRDRGRMVLTYDATAWPDSLRHYVPDTLAVAAALSDDGPLGRPLAGLWRRLFVAKRTRALLQRESTTTAFDALNGLGQALLHHLPPPSLGRRVLPPLDALLTIARALFLLEATACFHGFRSIALADQVVDELNQWYLRPAALRFTRGNSPYEDIALYSKAIGYLHARDHEKALSDFRKAKDRGDTQYLGVPVAPLEKALYWPDAASLFEVLVRVPATLQCAETLINLQRSHEADEALKSLEHNCGDSLTPYKRARLEVLSERIANDRAEDDPLPDPVWSLRAPPRNLRLQMAAVESERQINNAVALANLASGASCRQESGNPHRPTGATAGISADSAPGVESMWEGQPLRRAIKELGRARSQLRRRLRLAFSDRLEVDQAALSWCMGLRAAAVLVKSAGNGANCVGAPDPTAVVTEFLQLEEPHLGQISGVTRRICADVEYREHKAEVRKTAVRNLAELADACKVGSDLQRLVVTELDELLKELLANEDRLGVTSLEKREWRERKTVLVPEGLLPLPQCDSGLPPGSVPADLDAETLHSSLRRFLGERIVHPDEREAAQNARFPDPHSECRNRCVNDGDCSAAKRASNSSFPLGDWRHLYDLVVSENRSRISKQLRRQPCARESRCEFVVLQRWNSYTPAMAATEGGGYLLSLDRDGSGPRSVVIDPGYGFIKNLLAEGLSIADISALVVTHDHPDHLADVQGLVNLLYEARSHRGPSSTATRGPGKVEAFLSLGAFRRLESLLESYRDVFKDAVVMDVGRIYDSAMGVRIHAMQAAHRDLSDLPGSEGADALGVLLELPDDRGRIAVPSDTKWDPCVARSVANDEGCRVVCLHLGSIIPDRGFQLSDYYDSKKTSQEVLLKKQHLYLPGVLWFLEELAGRHTSKERPRLVLLSEFGEELATGLRVDLAARLQRHIDSTFGQKLVVLPADVGLVVDPVDERILCSCCRNRFPWRVRFSPEEHGVTQQIFYVCPLCVRTRSPNQRAAVFARRQVPLVEQLSS